MTDLLETPPLAKKRPGRTAAPRTVALRGIGTASPSPVAQADAMAVAQEFSCSSDGQRAWLKRVFSRAGVEQRGSVLMGERGLDDVKTFYGPPSTAGDRGPTTAARMDRYTHEAPILAQRAALAALADAGTMPQAVTHVITVSCTGFHAPGLDVELIERLGLSREVHRLHIGFMGCHAAFNALAAARETVLAHPDAVVLVCCVELSTLHFAYGWNPEKLVANALFADGASACIVGGISETSEPRAGTWRLFETVSYLLPDSRDAMTWRIGDHGFEMTLSATLPALIQGHLSPWCDAWLAKAGITRNDITHWAIHPGGPKIIAAAADSLGLNDEQIRASRTVLAQHGNMSSATLLFLLQNLACTHANGQDPQPGYCVAIGFGPGLMAEGLLLEIN